MKYKTLVSILIFFYLLFFPQKLFAQNVILNEFAVDSSPQQVEIFNTGSVNANISNWYIDDNGGTSYFTIPENTILLPNSCVVFSSDFNLNKSSADTLRLFDNTAAPTSGDAHLVDSFSYSKGAGINNSFSRLPDGGQWGTAPSNFDSFNSTGTSCVVLLTPTTTPSPTPTSPLTITPSPSEMTTPSPSVSYDSIYINEALVYPDSGTFEKIEFFNNNDFSVTLTNWFIDDTENSGSTPKQFSLTIPAKGYATYELVTGIFNNDGDQVRILDFNKQLKDSFEYSSSTKNKSWGRVTLDSATFCLQEPSFSTQNNNCIVPTPTSVPTAAISKIIKTTITPTISSPLNSSPIKIPSASVHKTPSAASITNHSENSSPDIYNQNIPNGEVLGEDTGNMKNDGQKKALLNVTLFTSSSYSMLAFITLLLRIKTSL